ncbi:YjjG family noncanonical pyrimidine nucleotidase [Jeotgalibaca sp. A127]|uniref:YjjG family noncanonical pyrimidine nucleotidase n=1 Tax=Jeotgalibaca sp. A127 TaxID=3457324 RepID=UPI003FCF50AA
MSYKTLLFDIDDTLLDFKAAEHHAISSLMIELAIEPSEINVQNYSRINQDYWSQFEKGLLAKDVLIAKRFETFFSLHQLSVNGKEMDKKFRGNLEKGHFLIEGSLSLLENLKSEFDLYAVTNGVARTQHRRINDSGLINYFRDIFVSEETGFQKPTKEYFDYVFERIPECDVNKTLIIGDSLTSDILGGMNAGIDTCWFNPTKQKNPYSHIQPTYEITALDELTAILKI